MLDEIVKNLKINTIIQIVDSTGPTLDCGCGDKRYTKFLPDATGIDKIDGVFEDFVCTPDFVMNCEALSFENETFQNVCFFDVLEHTDDPRKAIEEAYRVLKPGGCLAIIDPNDSAIFYSRLLTLRFNEAKYGLTQHPHIFGPKDIGLLTSKLFRREAVVWRFIFTGYTYRKV